MTKRTRKSRRYQDGTKTWFLADVVERSETAGEPIRANRRYLTWVNTLLIRARSIVDAYSEAMKAARRYKLTYRAASGRRVRWKVLGLSSLVPVYALLKHGSEIVWADRGYLSAKRSDGLVRSKRELVTERNG